MIQIDHTHRSPTAAQKEAGNYRKDHAQVSGLNVAIENAKGSFRRGTGSDGKPWSVRMPSHYGYIKRTVGADGDQVDCYIGPHIRSPKVFVVNQNDADTGRFDEHKVFLGFASKRQVVRAYMAAFSDGKGGDRLGGIAEMSVPEFKEWLKSNTTKPYKFANGGAVEMQAGGAPDPWSEFNMDTRARDPWTEFKMDKVHKPDVGQVTAAKEGFLSGVSGDWRDKIYGASKASGLPDWMGPLRAPVGAVKLLNESFAQPETMEPEAKDTTSNIPLAIRDVPREAYQTTMDTLGSIYKHLWTDPMERERQRISAPSEGMAKDFAKGVTTTLSGVGDFAKGTGAALSLPAAPIQGAVRSLIGHPMSDVVTALAPEGEGMDYETAKGNVDLALSAVAPRGVRATGPQPVPPPRRPPPTADEIRDAARQNYADVRALGVEINPVPVSQLARRIESDLTDLGLTQRNVPETYGVIRNLQNPPRGSVMRAQDFENARQELVQARQNPANRREAVAANAAINHLDNYLANIPQNHVIQGDAARASELFQDARANWAAASRADTAAGKIELGELNATTAHGGQNIDNATRQALKQLVRPDKNGRSMAQKMGYSPEEIAQINRVARGTRTGNILRGVGKLAPTDFIKAAAHAATAHQTAGASIPLSILSYIAKRSGDASTLRNASRLDEMVRSRSPLHRSGAPPPRFLPPPSPIAGFLPIGATGIAGVPSYRQLGTIPAGAEENQP